MSRSAFRAPAATAGPRAGIASFASPHLIKAIITVGGGLWMMAVPTASSIWTRTMVFWFVQVSSAAGFYAVAVLFGFGYSGVMTSIVIIVREKVPLASRGISQGVVLCMAWIGMGLGGWQGGYFFDLSGGYVLPFSNAVASGVVNLMLVGSFVWFIASKRPSTTVEALGTPAPAPA